MVEFKAFFPAEKNWFVLITLLLIITLKVIIFLMLLCYQF